MRKINPKLKNQEGTALFMAVMLLASILTVAFGAASIIVPGITMSRSQSYSIKAYFAAESGAERVLWEIRKNNYGPSLPVSDFPNLLSGSLPNGTNYSIDYATSSPIITFTSLGSYSGSRRSVQVQYH